MKDYTSDFYCKSLCQLYCIVVKPQVLIFIDNILNLIHNKNYFYTPPIINYNRFDLTRSPPFTRFFVQKNSSKKTHKIGGTTVVLVVQY